jgi:IS30 family transposase
MSRVPTKFSEIAPAQISARLAERYPNVRVSHETLYQSLFLESRGALRKKWHASLRTGRAMRRAKAYAKRGVGQGEIPQLPWSPTCGGSRSTVPFPGTGKAT